MNSTALYNRVHGHVGHVHADDMQQAHDLGVCCECCTIGERCGRDDDPTQHDQPRVGGWLARIADRDLGGLPTFTTHSGAFAYDRHA